jgi:hypothetical protein
MWPLQPPQAIRVRCMMEKSERALNYSASLVFVGGLAERYGLKKKPEYLAPRHARFPRNPFGHARIGSLDPTAMQKLYLDE